MKTGLKVEECTLNELFEWCRVYAECDDNCPFVDSLNYCPINALRNRLDEFEDYRLRDLILCNKDLTCAECSDESCIMCGCIEYPINHTN